MLNTQNANKDKMQEYKLSHSVVSSTTLHEQDSNSQL